MLFNESGDVLLSALPKGNVVFHVTGTVLQQAGEGVGVFKIFALAERAGCCSQYVWGIYVAISVWAQRCLFSR